MSRAWKKQNLKEARDVIYQIMDYYKVEMPSDYHWKIDGVDVWPSSKRYRKHGKTKTYKKLTDIFPISQDPVERIAHVESRDLADKLDEDFMNPKEPTINKSEVISLLNKIDITLFGHVVVVSKYPNPSEDYVKGYEAARDFMKDRIQEIKMEIVDY